MSSLSRTPHTVNPARPSTRPIRPQRPKPVARPRLILPPAEGLPGLMSISMGKGEEYYQIDRIPSDFGVAFSVEKMSTAELLPVYNVCIDVEGGEQGQHICDCLGHERHGRCKHVRSLLTLFQRGDLSCELSVPPSPFRSIRKDSIPF